MKHIKSVVVLFVLMLFCSLAVQGQMARLYTNQHGLRTSYCYSVDIDSRGLVWVSATNMLGLFDGTRFQYLPITENGRQLFQYVYGVKEFEDDQYWVCSSQGLYLLNARTEKFQRIYLYADEDSVYGCAVNALIEYPKEGYKLITTDGFGTFVLDAKTMQVSRDLSERIDAAIEDAFVSYPMFDREGRLWCSSRSTSLLCIDLKSGKRCSLEYTSAAETIVNNSKVTALLETEEGMLIGTNNGLLAYNKEQNLVHELDIPSSHLYISALLQTNSHGILVGTDGRGIWEYRERGAEQSLVSLYEQAGEFDISFGKVIDMKEDSEGNVVVAFWQKGLVVIPPQDNCFHYHPISPLANGRNATCVTSMTIDKDKNYWVATDGCGVFTTDGMKLATARPINEGLRSLLVQDLKIDKHGTVWAGTFGGGVQYLENGQWSRAEWLDELSKEMVMTMHYDSLDDKLLIGTNGNGIISIDIAHQTVRKEDIPILYNQWISAILLDSERTLWIATSQGLVYYNQKTGSHGEVLIGGGKICNANAIAQDGNDILIACDEGLVIHQMKTHQQTCISTQQGLSTSSLRSITMTDTDIWVATRTNIASIDKKSHVVRNYSSFGGYKIGEFHRNSAVQPGQGFILFGGDNGIICFLPHLISNRDKELKHVYFTNFSTPLHTEELDASIFYAKNIHLENGNSSFTISFSCAELGDPERIHYDYVLEGHEQQWHTDAPAPSASYSSLPAGTYTFRVRAYLEDTPDKYIENTIEIEVAAPWYASVWAFIVYALLLLAVAYYIYLQIRNRKRQKEQLRLSAEQDRMKEAKLKLFTSITHELRSPLTMIESPLKQLMAEDENEEHQSLYHVMQRNCDRLLGIVKQITDIRKIDAGQLTLRMEEQDYVEYADQVFEQFKGVATVKNISFVVEHNEEELPMMMDATHFEKIITNILSNAFKFTPEGGKIIARSGIVGNHVELRFYNSGSHFNEEDLSHLWERFYQGSAGGGAAGSGIGLNLVYELVKLHHGTIEAKNVEPDGVEFTLHFPYYNLPTSQAPRTSSGSKPTLLLVDDDQEMIHYISSQLEKDFNIIAAFSGNSGWKKVIAQRPDVVVTDYRMPDGNGMELCQLIKSNPETENIPVIMLTGEGDEMLQLHSLNIQVDHYLEKPVNVMMLRSAISQVLRVREILRNKVRRTEMGNELPKPVMENAEDKLFNRVHETIKKHLDDSEFSVQQLSDEVGISRVHLNRKMKEHYGVSPNIFIKSFRLKQAAYLLANNSVNISEVAYRVGFSSHSYFTTSFHDYFGMSPKEFVAYYSDKENSEALQKLLE